MSGACRRRHHEPTAESWLFFSAHQWCCKKKGSGTVIQLRAASGRLANWDGASHAARDRGIAPRSNPGTCGSDLPWPKPTCQRRAIADLPDRALPGSHRRSWGGISSRWIITSGESEARRVFSRQARRDRRCASPCVGRSIRGAGFHPARRNECGRLKTCPTIRNNGTHTDGTAVALERLSQHALGSLSARHRATDRS